LHFRLTRKVAADKKTLVGNLSRSDERRNFQKTGRGNR
jgi:hypothetical protein